MDGKELKKRLKKNSFARVAFWQFMGFILLLCLIWVNEVMDLSYLFFGTKIMSLNMFRGCVLSAAVIIIAIVIVGHSYVQQKRIIQGLLTVCSSCSKIQIDQEIWTEIEDYVIEHSLAAFSHGFCPDCYRKIESSLNDSST